MKVILPKHLTDIEAIELVYGPPERTLKAEDMRVYQKWMTKQIRDRAAILLGAEMGLGKTGAVLKAIVELMAEGVIKKVLIVAPLLVAEETWPEEIAEWKQAAGIEFSLIRAEDEDADGGGADCGDEHGAVLHGFHVFVADDVFITGSGHENIGFIGGIFHRHDFVAFHRGLQGVDRVDLGHPNLGRKRTQSLRIANTPGLAGWPDAQQAYFRAYSSVPDNADYAFNLAVGLDRLSQRKLALSYYQRALEKEEAELAELEAMTDAEALASAQKAADDARATNSAG